jgi:hypothetical protein
MLHLLTDLAVQFLHDQEEEAPSYQDQVAVADQDLLELASYLASAVAYLAYQASYPPAAAFLDIKIIKTLKMLLSRAIHYHTKHLIENLEDLL